MLVMERAPTDSEKEVQNIYNELRERKELNFNLKSIVSRDVICRSVFSESATDIFNEDKQSRLEGVAMWISEGDLLKYSGDPTIFNIKPTDSEITVVRVQQRGKCNKPKENKWNLNDEAIPGDGTHLGESPSLVNLATLVFPSKSTKNIEDEYLLPLSSWDPIDNPHQLSGSYSTDYIDDLNKLEQDQTDKTRFDILNSHNSKIGLARKITNFLRKRCLKKRRIFH